jgi:hypothetical protein
MNYDTNEIKVIGVDTSRIRENNTMPGTWIIPFKLSAKPDESWVRNFNDVFKKNAAADKRKARVVDDCIEVNFYAADDQQKALDVLKHDIADTNAACKEIYEQRMKMQEDLRTLQKTQANTLQKIKDDATRLKY